MLVLAIFVKSDKINRSKEAKTANQASLMSAKEKVFLEILSAKVNGCLTSSIRTFSVKIKA